MKVSKITIGRLYNLGNYEHVRYELAVEVPEGESAAEAVRGLENILTGLKPSRRIKTDADREREAKKIEAMKSMTEQDWALNYGYHKGTREEIIAWHEEDLAREKKEVQAERDRLDVARSLFDDVGGAAQWKDGKLDWEDEP